jgi:hypothetical protein
MDSIDVRSMREPAALGFATLMIAAALLAVPSWRGFLADPCLHAAALAGATILILHITRRVGPRAMGLERRVVALFLAGMPLVYIASWFVRGGGAGAEQTWLWIEILGFPIFGVMALVGLRRRPWLLAAGIAAHGIAWDLWHVGSGYIPTWYAIGCLLADVGLSVYVAARIPAWNARRAHPSGRQARSPFHPDRSSRLPSSGARSP